MSPAASARWCPTPEQLMILEEMYRAGVRTPSAAQIQQITAHLSMYGKIEGKNVFYWFQNHKARDRPKLRRKLTKQLQQQHQQQQMLFHQQQFGPGGCGFCHHGYLDHVHQCASSSSSASIRPLGSYYSPPPLPPAHLSSMSFSLQGAGTNISGAGSRSLMMECNIWRRSETVEDDHQRTQMEKSTTRMYNWDHRMMFDDMNSSDQCAAKPLKTLELFPTTSTNLREDRENSTTIRAI